MGRQHNVRQCEAERRRDGPIVAHGLFRDIPGGIAGHRDIGVQRRDFVRDKRFYRGRVCGHANRHHLDKDKDRSFGRVRIQPPGIGGVGHDIETSKEPRGPYKLSRRRKFVVHAI